MNLRKAHLPLLAASFLAGCGEERSAAISFETENVAAGLVLSVDSIAPPAQRLGWFPYVATVRLDTLVFNFRNSTDGGDLVVEQMDHTPVAFAIQNWEPKQGWARIQVRLEGDLLAGGRKLRIRYDDAPVQSSNPAAVWAWIPDTLRNSWMSVLVDDFEHGELKNALPNQSVWFTGKSDSATMSTPTLVPAGGGRSGTAVSFEYSAVSSRNYYVLFETALSPRPVNFGSLDSIVFWARGNGTLSVSLDKLWPPDTTKTWMHSNLDSTAWQRWCVRPQDFDPPANIAGNVGWESIRDSITHLTFFATGSGKVMLDDIRIFGLNRDDFR